MNPFYPHLQLPWSLRSLDAKTLDRVTINLEHSVAFASPDTMGRHVSDIMSIPMVYAVLSEAEFVFQKCLSLAVQDEFLISVSQEALQGDGTTFIRFIDSPLIKAAKIGRPNDFTVFHYRLVLQNECIDVVCCKVPEVSLKHLREI